MVFMRSIRLVALHVFLYVCSILLFSCVSKTVPPEQIEEIVLEIEKTREVSLIEKIDEPLAKPIPLEQKILLTFAGDIMAHSNVTRMADFSLIYADIAPITRSDDLTFANLETPIHEDRPYENYPTFNAKPPYVEAAIEAGFDVFSLANNHTNDQGKSGIHKTHAYFSLLRDKNIYSAGIKTDASLELTYEVIEKNGFVLLFVAYTELLNSPASKEYLDFFNTSTSSRHILKQNLIKLREKYPCDLFIVSIHTAEPEYVIEVTKERKTFYYDLLDCGIDIIWANHPHVLREWELIKDANTGLLKKAVFYGMGNTISGQRYVYNFENPAAMREYTGDGMLYQLEFSKKEGKAPYISANKQYLITTHIDAQKNSLIKVLRPEFIDAQNETYKKYYVKRMELLEKIKGTTLCR